MKKHLTTWRVVCYLLYFLGVCTLVLGVTNARYSTVVSGTGTASVAAVELELDTKQDLSVNLVGMKPGDSREIPFTVKNSKDSKVSEVTQEYSVIVETTGNLPLEYTLTVSSSDNKAYYVAEGPSVGNDSNHREWTGGKFLHSTDSTHNYTLKVKWPEGEASEIYKKEIDLVTLTVDAKQVQPTAEK